MLRIRRADERGKADFGWLQSNHTFSFGQYFDPNHMEFRSLRVINDDRVEAGRGFGTHPHKDMEIISYVLSGQLEHKDSMGNGSLIQAGEFQRISAGTGITHSEFNPSATNPTHFLQIWIEPHARGLKPSYDQRSFPSSLLTLIASSTGEDDSMTMNQDAKIYRGQLAANETVELPLSQARYGWLQLIRGSLHLNNQQFQVGDGVGIENESSLKLKTMSDSEFLFFDLA